MKPIRIGLLGLGTVGSGVFKTLKLQEQKIAERLGTKVEVAKILVREPCKERLLTVEPQLLTTNIDEVFNAEIDVLVEVMGGVEPAGTYLERAMKQGCHVVTANKELMAKRGKALIQLANQHGVHLYYEASVAGGIPIIQAIRQNLQSNDIDAVYGILNGTTNYMISQMERLGKSYNEALLEAQALGYAEADPTSDVEGFDAVYKLYILAQLVFGHAPELHAIEREGITKLTAEELQLAIEWGYRLRLIACAEKQEGELSLRVKPSLVPSEHPLASVNGVYNGVWLKGNIVGDLMFTGQGAGEFPTASAVVEDLVYLLRQPMARQVGWESKDESAYSKLENNNNNPTLTEKVFVIMEVENREQDQLTSSHTYTDPSFTQLLVQCAAQHTHYQELGLNEYRKKICLITDQSTVMKLQSLEQTDTSIVSIRVYPVLGKQASPTDEVANAFPFQHSSTSAVSY